MGSRLSISKAYTTPLWMQSHGLSMTPVSAIGPSAQARETAQQEEEEELPDSEERLSREEKYGGSCIKKKIMSLTIGVKVILNLQARIMCIV
jgi:hypothetical protein